MNNYTHDLTRDVDLLPSLTSLEGLASWWTSAVDGDPRPGGELRFGFAEQHIHLRVDRADPKQVVWTCLRHDKFPEWTDTTITFDLVGGTFTHEGLIPSCDCYGMCSGGWNHYLRSLELVASGQPGEPWAAPAR